MYERVEVTLEQAQAILGKKEDHFFDAKAKEVTPAKLSRSIVALANADGGDLYVGIKEIGDNKQDRTWDGFIDPEEANGHVQQFSRIFPFDSEYSIQFLSCSNFSGFLLHLNIRKSAQIRLNSDGKIYVRKNAQNLPVSSEVERRRLELDKGIKSFEDEIVSVNGSDLSNSYAIIDFALNVIPFSEPHEWLLSNN